MIKDIDDIELEKEKYKAADDTPFARRCCACCPESYIELVDDSFSHEFGTEIIRYNSLFCNVSDGAECLPEYCPKVRIAIALASTNNDRCTKCDDIGSGKCGSLGCNDFPNGRVREECLRCEKLEIELTDNDVMVYCLEEECKYDKAAQIMESISQEV